MKRTFFIAISFGLGIIACRKNTSEVIPISTKSTGSHGNISPHHYAARNDSMQYGSRFITMDDANKMISSYLSSINSSVNDSDLRSLTVNADSLRAYLSDNSVRNVKLMLAHTLDWATNNTDAYAGYQSGAITIIIAAYDSSGNYVYHNNNNVLDYSSPCPYACGTTGSASSFLLQ